MGTIGHIPDLKIVAMGEDLTRVLRAQLRQVVSIQHELLRRLLADDGEVPLEFADAFEDAGNRMLDLSEIISRRWRESKGSED
jgi:hypothetical protein